MIFPIDDFRFPIEMKRIDERDMGSIVQTACSTVKPPFAMFVIIQILNLRKRAWVGKVMTCHNYKE